VPAHNRIGSRTSRKRTRAPRRDGAASRPRCDSLRSIPTDADSESDAESEGDDDEEEVEEEEKEEEEEEEDDEDADQKRDASG